MKPFRICMVRKRWCCFSIRWDAQYFMFVNGRRERCRCDCERKKICGKESVAGLFHRWMKRYWCERSATCTLGQRHRDEMPNVRWIKSSARHVGWREIVSRESEVAGEARANVRHRSPLSLSVPAFSAHSGQNQRGETHILNPSALKQPIFLTFSLPHTLFLPLASSLANFISLYKSLLANRKLFQLWSQCLNKQIVRERIP